MRRLLIKDLLSELNSKSYVKRQKNFEYIDWARLELTDIADEFVEKNRLLNSYFIRSMNKVFETKRFEFLLKRWLMEYLFELLIILDYFATYQSRVNEKFILEDNPLNRYAFESYYSKFKVMPSVKWNRQPNLFRKILNILLRCPAVLYLSLNTGLKIFGKRKNYKVMREALWGLYDIGGYYFHDDFLVDGEKIKKEDIILYSRHAIHTDSSRLKGFHDAKRSPYAHFDLLSLSLGIRPLFSRIIPKYIILGSKALFGEISSSHFSLFWSIYLYFIYNALLYEKVFSHYQIISEMGHNYFSASHVAEAIVCQNYKARYYLMHWSDISGGCTNKYILSFLGCDAFFTWGKAHVRGVEKGPEVLIPTGYIFKRFIKKIMSNRDAVLSKMDVIPKGKIITFFDESFGGGCKLTEEQYVTFWETAFRLAKDEPFNTILVKPKDLLRYQNLSSGLKKRFVDMRNRMEEMSNIHIVDSNRWSFIEAIGVSDIVVTQGMSSSATIAIICGVEGLYLSQEEDDHPFTKLFNNKLVFSDPDKLLAMVTKIIEGREKPLKDLPESILREYDAYDDDLGIDRIRKALLKRR